MKNIFLLCIFFPSLCTQSALSYEADPVLCTQPASETHNSLLTYSEPYIGYLNIIARRLGELATGQWEPHFIRLPLSQKMLEQCQESMRVPLWRATYGSNGRILWQVNVAYDEEIAAESQMITGRSPYIPLYSDSD